MRKLTEQEEFWMGKFASEYIQRNRMDNLLPSYTAQMAAILSKTRSVESVIEFGANIGVNLLAIRTLIPKVKVAAIEVNKQAITSLNKIDEIEIYPMSILDFEPQLKWDFVFTKGVLIHINPKDLNLVYQKLYDSSKKYICIIEFYNPTPVMVCYRGHENKLFKRDFCGELMDIYSDLELLDYGFTYHRDNNFPEADMTWFLLKK